MKYWTKALREAEAELEAARTRTAVNTAAKKLQRAKAELRALEATRRRGRSERLPVGLRPPALPYDLIGFADLESGLLQVPLAAVKVSASTAAGLRRRRSAMPSGTKNGRSHSIGIRTSDRRRRRGLGGLAAIR
jgi:hypothetical protein